jgi:hypothetical protein
MKKLLIGFFIVWMMPRSKAQELFIVSEPASNMPAKSIGIRISNYWMKVDTAGKFTYHLLPELMLGLSNKLMIHANPIISNQQGKLNMEGFSVYAKYRFLSKETLHNHFRMAGFARWSTNNTPVHMHEINLMMHNSGYEAGLIATQLLHKIAVSGTASFQKASGTGKTKYPYPNLGKTFNYSISLGKLLLPKTYVSFKQVNMNTMVELLGQYNLGDQRYFMDIVPSVQFIFNSVARVDIGWRKQLNSSIHRSNPNGFLIKFEYIIFNALK